ncbi:transglutaminase-like domain-containing protein [Nanoarchaeota archaeon]
MKEDEQEPIWKGPLKWVMAVFLILLIVIMSVPRYSVKLDPSPSYIPTIEEVFDKTQSLENEMIATSVNDITFLIKPSDPVIKQTADKISSLACESSKICNAKAIFYFVRDNIEYVNDPVKKEYIKGAKETLVTSSGDCDDHSVLLANLLRAVGIETRFVLVSGHIYVQIYIEDAINRYKQEDGWINLDPTCSNCEFSEVSYSTIIKDKKLL